MLQMLVADDAVIDVREDIAREIVRVTLTDLSDSPRIVLYACAAIIDGNREPERLTSWALMYMERKALPAPPVRKAITAKPTLAQPPAQPPQPVPPSVQPAAATLPHRMQRPTPIRPLQTQHP